MLILWDDLSLYIPTSLWCDDNRSKEAWWSDTSIPEEDGVVMKWDRIANEMKQTTTKSAGRLLSCTDMTCMWEKSKWKKWGKELKKSKKEIHLLCGWAPSASFCAQQPPPPFLAYRMHIYTHIQWDSCYLVVVMVVSMQRIAHAMSSPLDSWLTWVSTTYSQLGRIVGRSVSSTGKEWEQRKEVAQKGVNCKQRDTFMQDRQGAPPFRFPHIQCATTSAA